MFNELQQEASEGSERFGAALNERGSEDQTVSPERRLELLASVPAFSNPCLLRCWRIWLRLTEERFQSADRVVLESDTDDRLYLIVEGRAEASTFGPSGTVPLAAPGAWGVVR